MPDYRYEVAVSYASEDKALVDPIVAILRAREVEVFYADEREQSERWGEDLSRYLPDIYSNSARYCLIFVSKDYAKKAWPTRERKAAQKRALKDPSRVYILPVQIGKTRLPGLSKTIVYMDINSGPAVIAQCVLDKLAKEKRALATAPSKKEPIPSIPPRIGWSTETRDSSHPKPDRARPFPLVRRRTKWMAAAIAIVSLVGGSVAVLKRQAQPRYSTESSRYAVVAAPNPLFSTLTEVPGSAAHSVGGEEEQSKSDERTKESGARAKSDTVLIRVSGGPDGATVSDRNTKDPKTNKAKVLTRIPGEFWLPRSGDYRLLYIEKTGYKPQSKGLTSDRNQELTVVLQPEPPSTQTAEDNIKTSGNKGTIM